MDVPGGGEVQHPPALGKYGESVISGTETNMGGRIQYKYGRIL